MPAATTRDAIAQFISAQEEKRDVAQIQVEIYVAIEQAMDVSDEFKQASLEQLDSGLFDVNVVSVSGCLEQDAGLGEAYTLPFPKALLAIRTTVRDGRDPAVDLSCL
jgi:hypothetical protein